MIPRLVQQNVIRNIREWRKIVIILGPRQSGKTTLLKSLRNALDEESTHSRYFNCDTEEDLTAVNTTSLTRLSQIAKGITYLLVDEAQRMDNPGLTCKILYDHFPSLHVITTGSSSFDLKNSMSDAMTGRYVDFLLYPLSIGEIAAYEKPADERVLTDSLVLYGGYPEVYQLKEPGLKRTLLGKIVESYLFKDLLAYGKIRHSEAIRNLTQAIAYQVGSELNENELASRVKIDRKTLVHYLDVLEKGFVILRLYPYSQNPRREIGRRYKAYFVDTGIRNALVGDFNPVNVRSDSGALWENYVIMERAKRHASSGRTVRSYFWRSYNGSEVDYLERDGETMNAWEIKEHTRAVLSRGAGVFTKLYRTPLHIIHRDNYFPFVTESI